jgi:putative endonuclease
MEERSYYVYILANAGHTVLYIGMTNDLLRRMDEHRRGEIPGFTQKYKLKHLIYFESTTEVTSALEREKELKGWSRLKKEALIALDNPQWFDLYDKINVS